VSLLASTSSRSSTLIPSFRKCSCISHAGQRTASPRPRRRRRGAWVVVVDDPRTAHADHRS
jgi:hypothetical protein